MLIEDSINLTREKITKISCDVIVNSANPWLGGIGPELPDGIGGVDGEIHRAAGINLLYACQKIKRFSGPVFFPDNNSTRLEKIRCNYGDLKITKGYRLPCKKVFHVVPPRFRGGDYGEMTTLEALYDKIFYTLIASQLKHIVLPAIGTGSYGMPKETSARIAVSRAQHYAEQHQITVEFSIHTEDEFNIYKKLIESK